MPVSKNKKINITQKGVLLVLILAVVFVGTAIGFYNRGFEAGTQRPKNITVESVTNIEAPEELDVSTEDFSIFWEVWNRLKERHPDAEDADDLDLIYGAIGGLTESLGDPHTTFFNPEDTFRFNEDISGHFSGIGAEIGIREDQLVIVAPLEGTPADAAGLLPGDKITKIDGESTVGITVDEAVKTIRGEQGSVVVLTILREGAAKEQNVSIVRDDIEVPGVTSEVVDSAGKDFLHLKIHNFSAITPNLFANAISQNPPNKVDGIIVDLRNNPGGFLDTAVNIAGWFISRGETVVTQRFASGEEDEIFKSKGKALLKDVPTVVLVNEGSASASEILAGALRHYLDTPLVGEKTFGKGTVQQLEQLSDGSSLKVTTANWLLPDGILIEDNGLEPNFVVTISEEDILSDKDPQLNKAIEALKSIL